jgi:hypothetical protein
MLVRDVGIAERSTSIHFAKEELLEDQCEPSLPSTMFAATLSPPKTSSAMMLTEP